MGWLLLFAGAVGAVLYGRAGTAATQETGAPTQAESTTRSIFGALPGVFNVIETPASELDWSTVRHFTRESFYSAPSWDADPIDTTPYLRASVVRLADELRSRYGRPLMVSPAPGAVIRTYGNPDSDHYVGKLDGSRLSAALDLMDPAGGLVQLSRLADGLEREGMLVGFGAYPDWQPHPGIHVGDGTDSGRWMAVKRSDGNQEYVALSFPRIRERLNNRIA